MRATLLTLLSMLRPYPAQLPTTPRLPASSHPPTLLALLGMLRMRRSSAFMFSRIAWPALGGGWSDTGGGGGGVAKVVQRSVAK